MEKSLLCDEEFLSSPPLSPPGAQQVRRDAAVAARRRDADEKVVDDYLTACVTKQHSFLPRGNYAQKLRQRPELSAFRHRSVRGIIVASARLNLALGTPFSAVNYLDRFVSLHISKKWELWMLELLSVACLSIAAKFDEVWIPSFPELLAEDLGHSFHPRTIQRMELAVLQALDWRLNCVTAHSFVHPLTNSLSDSDHDRRPHASPAVADRVVELLVGALPDADLLEFSPSAVAMAALRRALEELAPAGSRSSLAALAHLQNPQQHRKEIEECYKIMSQRVADPAAGIPGAAAAAARDLDGAPVTVITGETSDGFGAVLFGVDVHAVGEERLLRGKDDIAG